MLQAAVQVQVSANLQKQVERIVYLTCATSERKCLRRASGILDAASSFSSAGCGQFAGVGVVQQCPRQTYKGHTWELTTSAAVVVVVLEVAM